MAERRLKVARLLQQKKTQLEIAKILKVDRKTICNDIAAIKQGWDEEAKITRAKMKAEEKALIDDVQRLAYDAWERSRKPFT